MYIAIFQSLWQKASVIFFTSQTVRYRYSCNIYIHNSDVLQHLTKMLCVGCQCWAALVGLWDIVPPSVVRVSTRQVLQASMQLIQASHRRWRKKSKYIHNILPSLKVHQRAWRWAGQTESHGSKCHVHPLFVGPCVPVPPAWALEVGAHCGTPSSLLLVL